MNFIPLGKRVLIQREVETNTTASGIIIPDSVKEKPQYGTVIAVSSEVKTIALNDTVLFGKFNWPEVTIEGNVYIVLDEEHILGKMSKD